MLNMLKESPTYEFAILIDDNIKCSIPVENIVAILLDTDEPENGVKYLKAKIENHTIDDDQELEKLKQSYESLLRFSFLAQDEEQFSNTLDSSKDQLHNLFVSTKLGQISPESNKSENKSPSQQITKNVNNQKVDRNDLNNQDMPEDNVDK